MQFNAMKKKKFHYKGSAFVAYVLYGLWKRLEFSLLP